MTIEKERFRVYQSEEAINAQKEKSWTISIRVNAEEQAQLKELQKDLNVTMDGRVIKIALSVLHNVIHGTIGSNNMRYISDVRRRRYEQE